MTAPVPREREESVQVRARCGEWTHAEQMHLLALLAGPIEAFDFERQAPSVEGGRDGR